ncbi:PREDICTED: uncharacterized protein LOC109132672 [Camelina sativa]|uniref:Uncharacterized protein LOC109132672 n=1 Tax=Camelina sativa TaxID=90675 RepID=A0ABM1RMC8_CAMSA|nr:PREDICTED: uncharacterized protein LOC109132672 [Camelina sativa]
MAKWNVIMVIMLVMIAAIGGEARHIHKHSHGRTWIGCFRYCSRNCTDFDGNCFENCKIKCGGPTPPKTSSRNSHGKNNTYNEEIEVRGKRN